MAHQAVLNPIVHALSVGQITEQELFAVWCLYARCQHELPFNGYCGRCGA